MSKLRAILAIAGVIVSGCVSSQSVGKSEIQIRHALDKNDRYDGRAYDRTLVYARELADAYIEASDRAASARDVAALALIGAAGVAAGGLLFDAGSGLLKGAGLAAGVTSAGANYFSPGEASHYLLDAAEQLLCVSQAGERLERKYRDNDEALSIISNGVSAVRINLRKKMARQTPDYKAIVRSISQSIVLREGHDVGLMATTVDRQLGKEEQLSILNNRILACQV